MIGLPDVDEDLVRIEQVINGNGVEARFEFIEKEELDEQEKNLVENDDERRAQEQDPMPPFTEGRLGNNPKPEQQRNCREERDDKIAMKAGQKQMKRFAGRSALRPERGKQKDPQYEPASK